MRWLRPSLTIEGPQMSKYHKHIDKTLQDVSETSTFITETVKNTLGKEKYDVKFQIIIIQGAVNRMQTYIDEINSITK